MRIYAISDTHLEHPKNVELMEAFLSKDNYEDDILILAGDIADTVRILIPFVKKCADKFKTVCYVPGNHDLWMQSSESFATSLKKWEYIQRMLTDLMVVTRPAIIEALSGIRVQLVPLLAWHHPQFDNEDGFEVDARRYGCRDGVPKIDLASSDNKRTKWNVEAPLTTFPDPQWNPEVCEDATYFPRLNAIAQMVDSLNDQPQQRGDEAAGIVAITISISHFLPFIQLNPEKRFLFYPYLPKLIGSNYLGCRVHELKPDVHVFGHTHFAWSAPMVSDDGWQTHFIQAAMGRPNEREIRRRSLTIGTAPEEPVVIWEESNPFAYRQLMGHWSEYYSQNQRDCTNIEPAPYVLQAWDQMGLRRSRRREKDSSTPAKKA